MARAAALLLQLPAVEGPVREPDPIGMVDPLNTVGLALLAYGLVQLLSRVLDRIPLGRAGDRRQGGTAGGDGEGKRVGRLLEIVAADAERTRRLEEMLKEIVQNTRWLAEQRNRRHPTDGEPPWNCRGPAILDQLKTQQRLTGQALDGLREIERKLDDVLRKLRALWQRVGRRRRDQS